MIRLHSSTMAKQKADRCRTILPAGKRFNAAHLIGVCIMVSDQLYLCPDRNLAKDVFNMPVVPGDATIRAPQADILRILARQSGEGA